MEEGMDCREDKLKSLSCKDDNDHDDGEAMKEFCLTKELMGLLDTCTSVEDNQDNGGMERYLYAGPRQLRKRPQKTRPFQIGADKGKSEEDKADSAINTESQSSEEAEQDYKKLLKKFHETLSTDRASANAEPTKPQYYYAHLVWARVSQQRWWPALVIPNNYCDLPPQPDHLTVFWFGDHKVSQVPLDCVQGFFTAFMRHYHSPYTKLFKQAVAEAIKEARSRAGLVHVDNEEGLIDWVRGRPTLWQIDGCPSADMEAPTGPGIRYWILMHLIKMQTRQELLPEAVKEEPEGTETDTQDTVKRQKIEEDQVAGDDSVSDQIQTREPPQDPEKAESTSLKRKIPRELKDLLEVQTPARPCGIILQPAPEDQNRQRRRPVSLRQRPVATQLFQVSSATTRKKSEQICEETDGKAQVLGSFDKTSPQLLSKDREEGIDLKDNDRLQNHEKADALVSQEGQLEHPVIERKGQPVQSQDTRGQQVHPGGKVRGHQVQSDGSSRNTQIPVGQLVWAQMSHRWWPAMVILCEYCGLKPQTEKVCVFWFGDHKVSQVLPSKTQGFCEHFSKFYRQKFGKLYYQSVTEALQEALKRAEHPTIDTESLIGQISEGEALIGWAQGKKIAKAEGLMFTNDLDVAHSPSIPSWIVSHLDNIKQSINNISENDEETSSSGPCHTSSFRIEHILKQSGNKYKCVREKMKKISDVCIACDSLDTHVVAPHPLFEGGLCQNCKEVIMETMFVFGEDGTNVFCVICGGAGKLFVCDSVSCNRVYCTGCIHTLVSKEAVNTISTRDPWFCFMCQSCDLDGNLLIARDDWQKCVLSMYKTSLPQIPKPADPKPIHVLSLFDGIGTGKLILDDLNLEVEAYYASELDESAITVTRVRHGQSVQHLGDITQLALSQLSDICPIDLVLGGSPCNEFSVANPQRKGLEGGSGLLFFEYFRVLSQVRELQPQHPVFWLFENVASMSKDIKDTISRFLKCEPAKWDAIHFSPHSRPRYFWGNIPGMYSPSLYSTCVRKNVNLDDVLMPHSDRRASVEKLRTMTTRQNSLMIGPKEEEFPVHMGDEGDIPWVPELEKMFGFPEHYTDVGNMSPTRRRKLLGQSWSVPVVKHILRPLRQFFKLKN